MVFTIIIVLIVALVLVGIIVNAIQQHKNKVETERRAELSKQKSIIVSSRTNTYISKTDIYSAAQNFGGDESSSTNGR